ncbi:class I SAM-dependent methyltransferase [Pontibacter harenae]|uniref:class I SAM-dependent methyltransferase n=1 Tax=Pontibacter harenae TaxID=2894083 RepID=UPI001E2AE260|nr:class I SAM-dependent methyltransferase [Pontibacter harenae]MCC9165446.1 class I SAM-dependent methyltransferase [Pontibacter harenae]
MSQQEEWFSAWFNSPYYHILYKNRNAQEAQLFIDNLLAYIQPDPSYKVLDLACGRGRHSVYLNQKGCDVTGLDLSASSIKHAKQFEKDRLHFEVHDMRAVYKPEYFDLVVNLYTSFGYFESEVENIVALSSTAKAVKPGGKLVIDFMNTSKTIAKLVPHEEKEINGITFRINRKLEAGFIVKDILFSDKGKNYEFEERVRVLREKNFRRYFRMAQLELVDMFGDYNLKPYHAENSDRMIFILTRP